MIRIKTDENALTNIGEAHVKTDERTLTKIKEGYQVVSVNGVKALTLVFANIVIPEEPDDHECVDSGNGYCECGQCMRHFDETVYVEISRFYHSPVCAHCGHVNEGVLEGHGVDHYEYVGESTRVPVCVCGFEFDPEHYEPEPEEHEHDWDANTGTCSCGESCDHPEVDDNYCTTCGYCVSA